MINIEPSAIFSPCRTYRYVLWRWWQQNLPAILFIGLNPSTADEQNDDPTIRRCVGFARSWGYGGVCMVNLFAFRATQPADLKKAVDPVGVENDTWLMKMAQETTLIVACWGIHGGYLKRDQVVCQHFPHLFCFGSTKHGHPRHPLYIRRDCPLESFCM